MEIALVLVALLLAFSNGANDNFKGFASVWGRLLSVTATPCFFHP